MGILKDNFLTISIILSLAIRLVLLSIPGFKIDMDTWASWAIRLNQTSFSNFYSDQFWTNYAPGYLYVLWFLGLIKNLFNLNNYNYYLLLKIPSTVAEIALAIFVYKILKKNNIWARISLLVILLNPALIFNSAVWGQIDSILTLFIFISIYFLYRKKLVFSSIFLAISFLIKPQSVAILPVFGLFIINNISFNKILKIIIPFFTTLIFLSLPFFGNNLQGLGQLFLKMLGDYPYSSLFAYNLWGVIGFWLPDSAKLSILSYQQWGYIFYIAYWIILSYFYLTKRISIIALTVLALLSFYFLPTKVHDRYLYPAIPFLVLLAARIKSKIILAGVFLLTIIHLMNLYFVYVYYNELYLNLPKILYQRQLYNLIENSAKTLSLISTLIFLVLTYIILKSKHAEENV